MEILFALFAFGVLAVKLALRPRLPNAVSLLDDEPIARRLTKAGGSVHRTPIAEVGDAAFVRVIGKVARLDDVKCAPLSMRPCAYSQIKVSVLQWAGTGRWRVERWRDLLVRRDGGAFKLGDNTGECVVDPSLAVIRARRGRIDEVFDGRALPQRHREFLALAGVTDPSLYSTKVRFEESIVCYGGTYAVVGSARGARSVMPESGPVYRVSQPRLVCLSGVDDDLLITDARDMFAP